MSQINRSDVGLLLLAVSGYTDNTADWEEVGPDLLKQLDEISDAWNGEIPPLDAVIEDARRQIRRLINLQDQPAQEVRPVVTDLKLLQSPMKES